jgi:hypothetical protein
MWGDGWEDYLEGRERMDLIKTAPPHWKNLNVSDSGRLDELFDHTKRLAMRLFFLSMDFLSIEPFRAKWFPINQAGNE